MYGRSRRASRIVCRTAQIAVDHAKPASTGESYEKDPGARNKDLIVAGIATFYSALMIYSGGLKYILLSALVFLPATLLFWRARKDAGLQVFAKNETLLFVVIAIGAVIALWALMTGVITV